MESDLLGTDDGQYAITQRKIHVVIALDAVQADDALEIP